MNSSPQQRRLVAIISIMQGFAVTATLLRCYVRAIMVKSFRADDYLMVLSMLAFIIDAALVIAGANVSHSLHVKELPLASVVQAMKLWYFSEIAYVCTIALVRVSIAMLLYRLATKRIHSIIIWVVMATITIYSVGYLLFMLLQCWPIQYFWRQFEGQTGRCADPHVVADLTYMHSFFGIVADWTLAVLPTFLIWGANLNMRTKMTLSVILGLGAVGTAAVIVRFPYIVILVNNPNDFLFYATDVLLWSMLEAGLGITASCLTTLRPLFRSCLTRAGYTSHEYTMQSLNREPDVPMRNLAHKRHKETSRDWSGGSTHAGQLREPALRPGPMGSEKGFQVSSTKTAESNGSRGVRGQVNYGSGQSNSTRLEPSKSSLARGDGNGASGGEEDQKLVIRTDYGEWFKDGAYAGGILKTVEVRSQTRPTMDYSMGNVV